MRNLCRHVALPLVLAAVTCVVTVQPVWAAAAFDGDVGHLRYYLLGSFVFLLILLVLVITRLVSVTRGSVDRLYPIVAHVVDEKVPYTPKHRDNQGKMAATADEWRNRTADGSGPMDPTKMGMTKILPKQRSAPGDSKDGVQQPPAPVAALEDPDTLIVGHSSFPTAPIQKHKDEDPWEALLNKVKQDESPSTSGVPSLPGQRSQGGGLANDTLSSAETPQVVKGERKARLSAEEVAPIQEIINPPIPQRKVLPAPIPMAKPDMIPPPERASGTQKIDNLNFRIDMSREEHDPKE